MSETWTDEWGRTWVLAATAPEPAPQEPPAAGDLVEATPQDPAPVAEEMVVETTEMVPTFTAAAEVPDPAEPLPDADPLYARSLHPDDAVASVSAAGHHAGGHDGFGAGASN